jgi:OFA family oxalate/formate antiporter-like MFS transporter
MGFGFGSMALGTISTFFIGLFGWRLTFLGIAAVCFVLALICSFIIYPPPKGTVFAAAKAQGTKGGDAIDFTTGEMLKDPYFWLFFVWAVCLSAGGLALIGHAAPLAIDMGAAASAAAFYTGLISVFNGIGRVLFGFLFDRSGRRLTMFIVSFGLVAAAGILMGALYAGSTTVLVLGYICAGLSYGGIMPCNSTVIGKFYGQKNYPMNFSIITMNILIASLLGPFMAGVLQRSSGSYLTTLYVIGVFGLAAVVLNTVIRQKSALPK